MAKLRAIAYGLALGFSLREVARRNGVARNTVRRFLKLSGVTPELLAMSDEVEDFDPGGVAESVRAVDLNDEHSKGPRRTRSPKACKLPESKCSERSPSVVETKPTSPAPPA